MTDGLSLKDFIEKSLVEICTAVESAREKMPYIAKQDETTTHSSTQTIIDFDIGVTVASQDTEKSDVAGKAAAQIGFLRVLSTKVSASGELATTTEKNIRNENRIRFSVPVFFRYNEEKNIEKTERIRNTHFVNNSIGSSSWTN